MLSETIRPATSTPTDRAPVLNSIGKKTVNAGQSLDFTISASDPQGDPFTFSAQNLPPGATLNSSTGQFHWQPSTPGTFSKIAFIVTQTGNTPLSDAELIDIQVDPPQPAGTLAFSTASSRTGEGGPALLFVSRTNGNAGTVTVAYSTANGNATPGSDYTAVTNAVLTFANGEVTKSIRLNIINDPAVEDDENFQVTLSSPTGGATLGSPSQTNVTIVDDDTPSSAGQWSIVSTWPTVPIHMHLLPSGKVMFWDRGPDHDPSWDVTPRLWDPLNPGAFTTLPLPGTWDIFCSGHTIMADGRLFVAGGHIHDFEGAETAGIYDSQTNGWTALPNMNEGRWYPTTTILPNGDVLVISGTRKKYADLNPIPQVWQVNSGSWRNLSSAEMGAYPGWPDLYPFSFVAPNGKIFIAGPQKTARYLDTTGSGAWTNVANSSLCYRDYGSSVMYNDGKVLIVGGNPRDDCDPANIPLPIFPSSSAEVIDLNAATPAWRTVSPMAIGRRHLNTTILPDGKVLITGGSSAPGHDDRTGAVFFAELWDPSTESFLPLASHTRYRGYHSNALLLPDARVLVAGGGHPDPVGGFAENNAEIYSPPYLFKAARPSITGAPTIVAYGQTFFVQTPEAANITNVNWIRLGSTTHAFNESQRINRLTFSQGSGGLNVTAPASNALCPPGHYMLFVLNSNGVPSVARMIQIAENPGKSMQLILEEAHGGTNLGAAVDSSSLLRDPFLILNNSNFLAPAFDRNTRVTIFVSNLELAAGESASTVMVQLTDSSNSTHTISAEDVRRVPGFDFSQVVFRLPSSLPAGNCTIKLIAHGQTTNEAVIRIRVP
ncbi:MAG TPA: galactose oxidase-like domain-containing protein [Pyrinomonadaceae bacterium]|nr:galactose oxidase-like domain-containing protein [Pyrinomonadaceae bacterium]